LSMMIGIMTLGILNTENVKIYKKTISDDKFIL
jgi:hypothetical protein